MYLNILKLVFSRKLLSLLLLVFLVVSATMQGLAVSIIAPLIDIAAGSESQNQISQLFFALFNYIGIQIDIPSILGFALLVALIASLSNVVAIIIQKRIQLGYEYQQKEMFYGSLEKIKPERLHLFDFGNVIQVVQQETRMSSMLIEYMVRLVAALIQMLVYLSVLFAISGYMTVFVLAALFVVWACVKRMYTRAKVHGRKIGECNDELQNNVNLMLLGFPVLKSFSVFDVIVNKQKAVLKDYINRNTKLAVTEASLDGLFQPLALLIILTGYKIYQYTVAELFVFTASIIRLYNSVQAMQNLHYKISKHYASLERSGELADKIRDSSIDKPSVPQDKKVTLSDSILCQAVSFGYRDGNLALNQISFQTKHGEQIAFVGSSGAGKSTALGLILGLLKPSSGSIYIDGTDLSEVPEETWSKQIGYVPQEPFMIRGSIYENVCFYRNIAEGDVIAALKEANAWEFIENSQNGIHTHIGEGGKGLSGGQKQRISLARALVNRPQLLVLDEATSALDNASERLVKASIDRLHGQMTVIIVAHRLSTIRHVDTIFVFNYGEVVEKGGYDRLLSDRGYFYDLVQSGI